MFILYFYGDHHEKHWSEVDGHWLHYPCFREGEAFWLVPGTHPDDPAYIY